MTVLRQSLRAELAILAVCFAAVVVWKILVAVMWWARRPAKHNILAGGSTGVLRIQMPAASLLIALLYLVQLPQAAAMGDLPPVPEYALVLLAGSQSLFLVVMARRLLRPFGISKNEGEK